MTTYEASAAELRREVRQVRRAHSDRTLWQVAQDAYIAVFAVLMLSSMAISALSDIAGDVTGCSADACTLARGPMANIVLLTASGVVIRGLSTLGPVVASGAAASWLLSTPADRGVLLRRSFALSMLSSAAGAGIVMAAAAAVAGTMVRGALTGAAIGAAIGAVAAGLSALVQSTPTTRRVVGGAGNLLLLATAAGVAYVAFGQSLGDASWLIAGPALPAAGVLGAVAILLCLLALRRLVRLALPEIVSGGELLSGVAGAAYALDPALIGELVVARRFRLIGARSSRRGHAIGGAALVERELLRLLRTPGRFVVLVALAVVPQLFDQAGLAPIAPLAAGVAGYAAVRWSASGFRRAWLSPGLQRALPYPPLTLLLLLTLPAAALSLLWSAAAAPALSPTFVESVLAVGLSSYAGVVRAAAARRPDYGGPLITSPMGAVPPGLFMRFVRGPDFALLGTIALAVDVSPMLSIGVPALLLLIAISMATYRGDDKTTAGRTATM